MTPRRAQRGAVLLIMLAIVGLGASWFLVSALNAETGGIEAQRKKHNAEVLARAKLALIGYVAAQAAKSGENNPGAFPCPEGAAFVGVDATEGTAGGTVGAPTCVSVGRLPWRTIGLDKLVDSTGEPLWYVVGPTWRKTTTTTLTTINSGTAGDITVDGSSVVALIIAPGMPIDAQAATGCTARQQTKFRTAPSATMNASDYLECFDSATLVFSSTSGSTVRNDQLVSISTAEVMPAIEAAVADRINREIAPVLATVYGSSLWGTSASAPAFAFPAAFADPSTSGFLGQAGLTQGLLPFNYHSASCPGGDPRCLSNVVSWASATPTFSTSGGPGYLPSGTSCYWSGSTRVCEGFYYGGAMNLHLTDRANGITTGMRTFTAASHNGSVTTWNWNGGSWDPSTTFAATTSRTLLNTGAVNFVTTAALPSVSTWGYYQITRNRPSDGSFDDHSIIKTDDATTGWFARNQWYRYVYYAIANNHAPGGTLSCIEGGSGTDACLQVANLADANKQRAILILAGRPLAKLGQAQPSASLQNYLDDAANRDGNLVFSKATTLNASNNDRFISVARNP
jgi:hypothetical protein